MLKLKGLMLVLSVLLCVSCRKVVSDDKILIYKVTPDSLFKSSSNSNLFRKSQELEMKGKYKEALNILLELEWIEPENKLILGSIGGVYIHLKQYNLSEKYYKKAIEVDPYFFYNWVNLSTLYISKKEFEVAFETLMNASHLEKTEEQNVLYILQQAIIKYHLGDCKEVSELCDIAVNLTDDQMLINEIKKIYDISKKTCINKN